MASGLREVFSEDEFQEMEGLELVLDHDEGLMDSVLEGLMDDLKRKGVDKCQTHFDVKSAKEMFEKNLKGRKLPEDPELEAPLEASRSDVAAEAGVELNYTPHPFHAALQPGPEEQIPKQTPKSRKNSKDNSTIKRGMAIPAPSSTVQTKKSGRVSGAVRQSYMVKAKGSDDPKEKDTIKLPPFAIEEQIELIGTIFTKHNLRCDPTMRNFIISQGTALKRLITEHELEWYCQGIKAEQVVSTEHELEWYCQGMKAEQVARRAESIVAQLKDEVGRLQLTTKALMDLETKYREIALALTKARYAESTSPVLESSCSSPMAAAPVPPLRIENEPLRGSDILKYTSFLHMIGFDNEIASSKEYEHLWKDVISDEDIKLATDGLLTDEYIQEMTNLICDILEANMK